METKQNKNIFTNDEWFAAMTAVMAVLGIWEAVLCFTTKSVAYILVPFMAVLGVFMFFTYKKHEKNAMKGMMGAALMWLFYEEMDFFGDVTVTLRALFEASLGKWYPIFCIAKILSLLVLLLVFVMHFHINYAHHSRPLEIRVNQFLNLLLIVLYIIDILIQIFFGEITIAPIVLMAFKLVLMFMVISIESRLDEFRLKKEAAAEPAKAAEE